MRRLGAGVPVRLPNCSTLILASGPNPEAEYNSSPARGSLAGLIVCPTD